MGKQLSLKVLSRSLNGVEKTLTVLVDTGAEADLLREDLFNCWEEAKKPISLRTVSGEQLGGGDKTITLQLTLWGENCQGEVCQPEENTVTLAFYNAAIEWDAIISYPTLKKFRWGVMPHRQCILWEKTDGNIVWLSGGTKIQGFVQKPTPRNWVTNDYAVREELVRKVVAHFGEVPTVDAFASNLNHRFPRFWTKEDNAFEKDWGKEGLLWINPPFEVMEQVVAKIKDDGARAIIIAPNWPHLRWFKELQKLMVGQYLFGEKEKIFIRNGAEEMRKPRWRVWAYLVDGNYAPMEITERQIKKVNCYHMKVVDGVKEKGGIPLEEKDIITLLRHLKACEEKLEVRSVVQTQVKNKPKHINDLVESFRSKVTEEFGRDVLSGKLLKDPPIRGPYGEASINIKLGAQPRRHRAFQLIGERADALKAILEEYKGRGWIEPSFSSWGSPAFVVPKKTPGEWRLVVDYRGLNHVTEHDAYQLPLISDMLNRHGSNTVFTVLDMKKGYHQMPLAPASRPCTAMTTPFGLWQWKVMPMGAKNGNAAFQRMMDWVLEEFDFADPFVDDVLISSSGSNPEDAIRNHLEHLTRVLTRFRELGLVCDLEKAQLFVDEVEFCGHVIGQGRRRPAPGKLNALKKWERPRTITELRSFLGFCNWYHDYIDQFANKAAPMMSMLQVSKVEGKKGSKRPLKWSDEASKSFEEVKGALLQRLELNIMDPDCPFVLRTDASNYAVGAYLCQMKDGVERPLAFWSRKLTKGQRNGWSPREKETYAIVEALKKWSGWIGLQPVVVKTDHRALESWWKEVVDTPSGPAGRRGRWHELLSKFSLTVEYVAGKDNTVADCLSRWAYPASAALKDVSHHGSLEDYEEAKEIIDKEEGEEREEDKEKSGGAVYVVRVEDPLKSPNWDIVEGCEVFGVRALSSKKKKLPSPRLPARSARHPYTPDREEPSPYLTSPIFQRDWTKEYRESGEFQKAWRACHGEGEWPEGFQVHGSKVEFLYKRGKLCVPEGLALEFLEEWHSGPMGHAGVQKMVESCRDKFEIPRLRKYVVDVKRGCQCCQSGDAPSWPVLGDWVSTPVPPRAMSAIAMDVCHMPLATNWDDTPVDAIFTIVDRLTGWVMAYPILRQGFTAKRAALLVYHGWLDIFGVPDSIMTDLGTTFTGAWFQCFCGLLGIHHAKSIAYKHNTNGRAEQAIDQVLVKLGKLHQASGKSWPSLLPLALRRLHDAPGPAGISPYRALFGRDRLVEGIPLPLEKECEDALQWHSKMKEADRALAAKLDLLHSQRQARETWQRPPTFKMGDKVWVLRSSGGNKLDSKWIGPCTLLRRKGAHTYDVQVSPTRTRSVHTSHIKPHFPTTNGTGWELFHKLDTEAADSGVDEWNVAKILRHRRLPSGELQFLVRWEGFGPSDDTWEPAKHFLPQFSEPWAQYCWKHGVKVDVAQNLGGVEK